MRVHIANNQTYRLPNNLTDFQLQLYVHLIDWKRAHLTEDAGKYGNHYYDALLPEASLANHHPIYPPIVKEFLDHQRNFPFKSHRFLGHMASSQAACVNLFLPMLQKPAVAARILNAVKPDIKEIATDRLDRGYRIEFWDEPDNQLGDHNKVTGTDSDIAIAYYDYNDDLNLWLIEHKLTEKEFTTCGGFRSKGNRNTENCDSIKDIVTEPDLCYYQGTRGYRYWNITLSNPRTFPVANLLQRAECPFKGGANQLWRNQLLASAIEGSPNWPYKKVFFSVVYHPQNDALLPTLEFYQSTIGDLERFSHFPSSVLVEAAKAMDDEFIGQWRQWYEGLYYC